jgi:hypothetical protein
MSYRIRDEPRPGALSAIAVQPFWPLLGVMFGGAWLSWPWFALNGYAVGSPTRGRELALALGGFAGSAAIIFGIASLAQAGVVEGVGIRYALVALTVWKLVVSYLLYAWQGRSFHLYEHFGGEVKNGLPVVVLAGFLGRRAVLGAISHNFWVLLVG